MATSIDVPQITTIQKTECIGNSLVTINSNYDNIKNSLTQVQEANIEINSKINNLQTFQSSVSSQMPGVAKAWVSFNGRSDINGSPSTQFTPRYLRATYNIKEVVRINTGIYRVIFESGVVSDKFTFTGAASPLPSLNPSGNLTGVINLAPGGDLPPGSSEEAESDGFVQYLENNGYLEWMQIVLRSLDGNYIDSPFINLAFFSL